MNQHMTTAGQYLASNPELAATIDDPERWASATGAEIQASIRRLTDSMTRPGTQQQSYLERRAQLLTAARIAEEVAVHDLLPTSPPEPADHRDWTPLLPDLTDLL